MHARGLKLGMYQDLGTKTCAGYVGTQIKDIDTDMRWFARMGTDYLKMDGCNYNESKWNQGSCFSFADVHVFSYRLSYDYDSA